MKKISSLCVFFILVLLSVFSPEMTSGQGIDSITKITFQYEQGHYAFGDPGKYGVGEIIEYSKQKNNSFKMIRWASYTKSYNKSEDRVITDTSVHRQLAHYLNEIELANLFTELNTTRDNFTGEFVKPYLKKPGRKEIFKILKKYDLKVDFKEDYSEGRDQVTALGKIENFYMLDSFMLKEKPDPESGVVVLDVWNNLFITVEKNGDTTSYRLDFFMLLGQPFRRVDNNDYINAKYHVNLEVNNAIYKVLPKTALIKKVSGLNALKEKYIRWLVSSDSWLGDDIE